MNILFVDKQTYVNIQRNAQIFFFCISNITFVLQTESPNNSELNALVEYFLWSLAFVIGALMEFAFVTFLDGASLKPPKGRKNTGISKEIKPIIKNERKWKVRFTDDEKKLVQRWRNTNGLNYNYKEAIFGNNRTFYIIPSLDFIDFLSLFSSSFYLIVFIGQITEYNHAINTIRARRVPC